MESGSSRSMTIAIHRHASGWNDDAAQVTVRSGDEHLHTYFPPSIVVHSSQFPNNSDIRHLEATIEGVKIRQAACTLLRLNA